MISAIEDIAENSIKIADHTSINDIHLNRFGIYYCDYWKDCPSTHENGTLMIVPRQGNNLTQIYIPVDLANDTISIRSRYSTGYYSQWKQLNFN